MILLAIFGFFTLVISTFFDILHLPVVTTLPFGIDAILVSGIANVYYITTYIPPLGIILDGFLFVLGWKTTLFFLRMFHIIA